MTRISAGFFTTVFSDQFIFSGFQGNDPQKILDASNLSDFEKELALRVLDSDLYTPENDDACSQICEQLNDTYNWQSNSEGPLIFSSKILFFLRDQNRDISWYIEQVRNAGLGRRSKSSPSSKKQKKVRATVILPTEYGILITQSPKGDWLLPGGQKNSKELSIAAAARELYEETKIVAREICYLFDHESEYYQHDVFLVSSFDGSCRAGSDAIAVAYVTINDLAEGEWAKKLGRSSREILLRYNGYIDAN